MLGKILLPFIFFKIFGLVFGSYPSFQQHSKGGVALATVICMQRGPARCVQFRLGLRVLGKG